MESSVVGTRHYLRTCRRHAQRQSKIVAKELLCSPPKRVGQTRKQQPEGHLRQLSGLHGAVLPCPPQISATASSGGSSFFLVTPRAQAVRNRQEQVETRKP